MSKYLFLEIEQGARFARTFLFGDGPCFPIVGFSNVGGGVVKALAPGHIFENGDYVKLDAFNQTSGVIYTGSYLIADVVAGESFNFTSAWKGSIIGTVQAARDLTGYGIRASVREDYGDASELFTLDGTIDSAVGGVASLVKGASATAGYSPTASAIWSCELYHLTDADDVDRIFHGDATVSPEGDTQA